MDNNLTFGQWLKRRRRGLGLTQRALGVQLGYASETIRKVEADELKPSRQLAERLAQALEVDPAQWDQVIRFARDEGDVAERPPPTQTAQLPATPRRHNLPTSLTSFIGRETELAQIRQLLTSHRLVTLTGAGGMGKTRLALAAGQGWAAALAGGVWLVELAGLADPAKVPQAVAEVLGVRPAGGQLVAAALADYVRNKSLGLILDNCEHLLGACAQLAQTLLQASPSFRILTTSREVLGLSGEAIYAVPSLSLPPQNPHVPLDDLRAAEAVQLFLDRAVTALPSFTFNAANAPMVVAICRQLEGMPLALELAAARVNMLSPRQIAERLRDRFGLLTGGSRLGLPRQKTLKATIEWSVDLLAEPERAALRRAAVFAGGFTLEAAEQVCASDPIQPAAVLDLLTSLARKSILLVEWSERDEPRYRFLETVREYAWECLLASGEAEAVQARHLAYFVQLAEAAEPHLRQADQGVWIERLQADLDNVRAALARSIADGHQGELAARLAAATWRFWDLYGYLDEGAQWLSQALTACGPRTIEMAPEALGVRGRLYARTACVLMWAGDVARGLPLAAEGLAICRETGVSEDLAFALIIQGCMFWQSDDLAQAQVHFEETITLAQAAQLRWHEASAHYFLSQMYLSRGDYERTEAHGRVCLAMCGDLGEMLGAADTLGLLAQVAFSCGRFTEATQLFGERLALLRPLRVPGNLVPALVDCGDAAMLTAQLAAARPYLAEALALAQERGDSQLIASALHVSGDLARREGDYERAEALLQQCLVTPANAVGRRPRLLRSLSAVARGQGDFERALALCREALTLAAGPAVDKWACAETVREMAWIATARGQWERAVRLFAAIEVVRTTAKWVSVPIDQADNAAFQTAALAELGQPTFDTARQAGEALSLEQAVSEALSLSPG
jgi:predicted ATPase/DNA-binding XRE family transcriptional regulator